MHAPRSRFRTAITCALMLAVAVSASGCASPWTFGTTKWVAQEEAYTDKDSPRPVVLVPFIIFDFLVLPVALIHDAWPRSHSYESKTKGWRVESAHR